MDLNISPYFDDTEDQVSKDYTQVVYNPGRAVQARELTQSQSLIYDQMKENFNTIYKNGVIVEGCELDLSDNKNVRISDGKFYIEGRVRKIEGLNTVDISGIEVNTEIKVGLLLNEEIIKYTDDSTLTDPASGFTNYNLQGADRIKISFSLVVNDENAITIYTILNGVIQDRQDRQEIIEQIDIFASRTNDESGSYLVNGMCMNIINSTDDSLALAICPGVAYVKGYKVEFLTDKFFNVNKSTDYKMRYNEPKEYNTGISNYTLNTPYVKDVDELKGTILITEESVQKGVGLSQDTLANTSVLTLVEVKQGAEIFVKGVDYDLFNDSVRWLQTRAETPSTGSTYLVTYQYNKNMEYGVDYTLVENALDSIYYDIHLTGTGDLPVDGSYMEIDYNYYLARTDLVTLDSSGNIQIKEGYSTEYNEIIIPDSSSDDLYLGWFKLFPNANSDNTLINSYEIRRTTMGELHNLKKRIDELEDNQAELALIKDATSNDLPSELRGLYVDTFDDFFKCDLGHPDFSAGIDVINGTLSLPLLRNFTAIDSELDVLDKTNTNGGVIFLETLSENEAVAVRTKTEDENINPYGKFSQNYPGSITIDPASDYWIEDTITTNRTQDASRTVNSNKYTNTSSISKSGQLISRQTTDVKTTSSSKLVSKQDQYVTYTRQRTISVYGKDWNPSEEIIALINGTPVSLVATGGTVAGAEYLAENGDTIYSVQTDGTGDFEASLTIPAGIRSGDITLSFEDNTANRRNINYKSTGVIKIFENVTTNTTTTYSTSKIYRYIAPAPKKTTTRPTSSSRTKSRSLQTITNSNNNKLYLANDSSSGAVAFISQTDAKNGGTWTINKEVSVSATSSKLVVNDTKASLSAAEKVLIDAVSTGKYDSNYGKSTYGGPSAWVITDKTYTSTAVSGLLKTSTAVGPYTGGKVTTSYTCTTDPLAQSFFFTENKTFTSMDFFFKAKSNTDTFFIQIGLLDPHSGYPDASTVFLSQDIDSADVVISNNGTIPTNIVFDYPVTIPKNTGFYISIGSESTEYYIYTSTLTKTDINDGTKVYSNPYLAGVMFRSSNTLTWESAQNKDLTFVLYEGNFETEGTVITENITGVEFASFIYHSNDFIPDNSSISYLYSVDQGSTWKNFRPNTEHIVSTSTSYSEIKFKFILKGDSHQTPKLSTYNSDVQFILYDNTPDANYITKIVEQLVEYDKIKMVYDVLISSGNTYQLYFSRNNNVWGKIADHASTMDSAVILDNGYVRNTITKDITNFQELVIDADISNLSVGDTITGSPSTNSTSIVDIDYINRIILIEDATLWADTDTIDGGKDISTVDQYGAETAFKGKVVLHSDNNYNSPLFKNVKWVLKV